MTDARDSLLASLLFASVVLLVGWDLVADAGSGAGGLHLGAEALAATLAGVGALWFGRRMLAQRAEAIAWRSQAEALLASAGASVDDQFVAWGLTPAEHEVGLLLLKGLSFKEIGQVRGTSDRTARDQARGIYRKASVSNRSELAAWFIEDLLPPS